MKKVILVIIVASAFLAACSQYTCPTYSEKKPADGNKSERHI